MWILSFIPDSILVYVINIVLCIGVITSIVGFVFKFVPLVPYRPIIQLVGILLLSLGLYFKGGYSVEIQWRSRVVDLQSQLTAAQAKSTEANTKIEIKIVERIKIVKQNVEAIKQNIKLKKEIINEECILNDTAIDLYNQAVTNNQGVASE
jgi:preprotein translocase subunit SecF